MFEAGKVSARPGAVRTFGPLALMALVWLVLYTVLQPMVEFITFDLIGFVRGSHFGEAVAFFLYDVPKILLLLSGMIFVITIIRTFFSAERTRQVLGGKRAGVGNVLAALLGIVTPFCSCSAVPLFIGFVESGIPLGVTFSFLISAPVINEVAVVLLFGMFGWKVATLYVISGLTMAIAAGMVIGRLRMERYVEDFVWQIQFKAAQDESGRVTWDERIARARQAVQEIVGKVWPFVVVGIGVGAGIHGYVPTDALAEIMGRSAWWSVPIAVLIGVPLYSSAAGMIPVVSALIEKGAALGTALAFMMAVVGVSLPETIILRRVLKPQLLAVFVGTVATAIVLTGYLFNLAF